MFRKGSKNEGFKQKYPSRALILGLITSRQMCVCNTENEWTEQVDLSMNWDLPN